MVTFFTVKASDNLSIHYFPVLQDNYTFIIHDTQHDICAVVDPALSDPVIAFIAQIDSKLTAIFNTHHHHDHVGGNSALVQYFPEISVYGGAYDHGRIPHQHYFLHEGDTFQFGDISVQIIFIPAHTKAHIAYYLPATGDLFCGDTLFAVGCGRLFEGTPQMLFQSLQKLAQLPEQTRVWCAHEYTLKNIKFALTVDGQNPALQDRFQEVTNLRQSNQPTIPSTIALEKATNPFLRWHDPRIQAQVGHSDPVRVLGKLRGMRDLY